MGFDATSRVAEHQDQLADTLESLDGAVNYMSWIADMVSPYLDGPILELGAGHGTFTERFAQMCEVHAIEPGGHAATVLRDRFLDHPRVQVDQTLVEHLPREARYGSAVMINVLEHIDDDADALAHVLSRLRPGGHIAIWVPAFSMLYSDFDRRLGHHRRYRVHQVEALLQQAGFRVLEARYANLPGWFSWLVLVRLLRQTPSAGPLVAAFDRIIVPATRAVEHRIRVPFGQSILAIARKPLQ